MNIIRFPNKEDYAKICERPHMDVSQLNNIVNGVLSDIRENGDKAVIAYEEKFDKVKLSTPYVSAHFKKITGMTVTDFISKRKIQEAAYLIGSGHYAVGEVSSLLQFSSQSYFTKIFRKYMGVTPEVYRRGNRQKEGNFMPFSL